MNIYKSFKDKLNVESTQNKSKNDKTSLSEICIFKVFFFFLHFFLYFISVYQHNITRKWAVNRNLNFYA